MLLCLFSLASQYHQDFSKKRLNGKGNRECLQQGATSFFSRVVLEGEVSCKALVQRLVNLTPKSPRHGRNSAGSWVALRGYAFCELFSPELRVSESLISSAEQGAPRSHANLQRQARETRSPHNFSQGGGGGGGGGGGRERTPPPLQLALFNRSSVTTEEACQQTRREVTRSQGRRAKHGGREKKRNEA